MPFPLLALANIVSVELPEPATVAGVNDALVLAGNPVTLNVMVAVNGPKAEAVTVYVELEFLLTV